MTLRVDVGTGIPCPGDVPGSAPIEVLIYLMNVSFDDALSRAGVPHEYRVQPCGVHRFPVWDMDVADWLPVLMAVFTAPPPPPASFSYRTAEPAWSVWGWEFGVDRPAVELLDLSDVSSSGLVAVGSGPLAVVTPPGSYVPGAACDVSVVGADVAKLPIARVPLVSLPESVGPPSPPVVTPVVADADGRLRFTVDLGPAHVENQFSPTGLLAEALALGRYYRQATVTITPRPVAAPPRPNLPPKRARMGRRTVAGSQRRRRHRRPPAGRRPSGSAPWPCWRR